jgi:hypothetical protein
MKQEREPLDRQTMTLIDPPSPYSSKEEMEAFLTRLSRFPRTEDVANAEREVKGYLRQARFMDSLKK